MTRIKRLGMILLCAAIAVLAVGAGGLWILSRPHPSPVGIPPADLGAEAVSFVTADGLKLVGWAIPGRPGRGVVILVHGSQGSRLSMLGRARFLSQAGYGVLLFDLRAHGESEGGKTTEGCHETDDVETATAYAARRFPGEKRAIIGFSLGGTAAVLANPPLAVDAMVLEAVSPDIETAYGRRLAARFGTRGHWLTPVLTMPLRFVMGCPASRLNAAERIGDIAAPKLFIAGGLDNLTLPSDMRLLAESAPQPTWMWVIQGAEHTSDFHDKAPQDYERRVLEFLDYAFNRATARDGESLRR